MLKILRLKYQDEFWPETAALAKSCSFQGSGAFLSACMTDNDFGENDRVFTVVADQSPIAFCTFTMEQLDGDCPHSPWLDFLFVSEAYRNRGIAGLLVAEVCRYAKEIGFTEIHLVTVSHAEMYAKMGFTFLDEHATCGCDSASVLRRKI